MILTTKYNITIQRPATVFITRRRGAYSQTLYNIIIANLLLSALKPYKINAFKLSLHFLKYLC